MKVKVTFECEVCKSAGPTQQVVEAVLKHNFACVEKVVVEEVEGFSRDENACP